MAKLDRTLIFYVYIASCSDGQIEVIEDYSEMYGRVKICSNQRWELLSSTYWGNEEARVACNALGYSYGM